MYAINFLHKIADKNKLGNHGVMTLVRVAVCSDFRRGAALHC